jgi:ethanolamine utilization protein EutN
MIRARVVGKVWATRRLPQVPHGAFLEVEADGGGRLVAFDVLGCGPGEQVLVATGSVAASWFSSQDARTPSAALPPIDALVIGSIDESSTDPDTSASTDPKE